MTGSGLLSLHQLSTETLAGRIEIYHLREFGLRETILFQNPTDYFPTGSLLDMICDHDYTEQLEQFVAMLSPFRPILEQSIIEEMIWGGLPEV